MEWKRRIQILGIVTGVYLGCRFLLPLTIPFLFGWILASMIYPIAVKLERKIHLKRSLIGAVGLLLLLFVIGVLIYKGITVLVIQMKMAIAGYDGVKLLGMRILNRCCCSLEEWTGIEASECKRYLLEQLDHQQEILMRDLNPASMLGALSSLKRLVEVFTAVILVFISGMMFLRDMAELKKKAESLPELKEIRGIYRRLKETVIVYLKAQLIIMTVVGTICAIGFCILKSPYYLLLGILLGVLDALPVIGTGTFLYPAALFFFIQGDTAYAVLCVILDLITSFAREYMEPKLLGKSMGIYPVFVLAAVYIGFFVYGWSGFILGPLSLSLIYEIGKQQDLW